MNESEKLLTELKDIRNIMERSSRFLSLSGLSGILIGVYALIGAFIAYRIVYIQFPSQYQLTDVIISIFIIGTSVLILSLFTIFLLTIKKARKEQKPIWGPGSKLLLLNLMIPLVTGALLIAILAYRGYYEIISSSFLMFYGLALVNAAKYTRPEILGLGILEIVLGLIAAILPGYGLYFWAFGFGVLHMVYGFIYLKYENKNPAL